jgi:hypothetical protein
LCVATDWDLTVAPGVPVGPNQSVSENPRSSSHTSVFVTEEMMPARYRSIAELEPVLTLLTDRTSVGVVESGLL